VNQAVNVFSERAARVECRRLDQIRIRIRRRENGCLARGRIDIVNDANLRVVVIDGAVVVVRANRMRVRLRVAMHEEVLPAVISRLVGVHRWRHGETRNSRHECHAKETEPHCGHPT
jgi:hypothetical protein